MTEPWNLALEQAPGACTLPTAERPLRLAEFDALFTTALQRQERVSPTVLRWLLDPTAEEAARDLTSRETECCSFFTFTFGRDGARTSIEVGVPAQHIEVLDSLEQLAQAGIARR